MFFFVLFIYIVFFRFFFDLRFILKLFQQSLCERERERKSMIYSKSIKKLLKYKWVMKSNEKE